MIDGADGTGTRDDIPRPGNNRLQRGLRIEIPLWVRETELVRRERPEIEVGGESVVTLGRGLRRWNEGGEVGMVGKGTRTIVAR